MFWGWIARALSTMRDRAVEQSEVRLIGAED